MISSLLIEFLFRWAHVLFGLMWVGLLYYFNFVQGEFLKEASAPVKTEVLQKLATRALWWFRWSSLGTLATGVFLFAVLGAGANQFISIAALIGVLMFINVWVIIWPNQKVVCGLKPGDVAMSAGKALLASRTNVLFSAPMLFGMLASKHGSFGGNNGGMQVVSLADPGFLLALAIVVLVEINAVVGRLRFMAGIAGVVIASLLLTALLYLLIHFL